MILANYKLNAEAGHINLSPELFRLGARDYFKSFTRFEHRKFSPVPFFLCCRAMELALKAVHLESKKQSEVKQLFSHDLIKCYKGLEKSEQMLSADEVNLLAAANEIHVAKEFEYLNVVDAATAFRRFPDLDALGNLAKKIIGHQPA